MPFPLNKIYDTVSKDIHLQYNRRKVYSMYLMKFKVIWKLWLCFHCRYEKQFSPNGVPMLIFKVRNWLLVHTEIIYFLLQFRNRSEYMESILSFIFFRIINLKFHIIFTNMIWISPKFIWINWLFLRLINRNLFEHDLNMHFKKI